MRRCASCCSPPRAPTSVPAPISRRSRTWWTPAPEVHRKDAELARRSSSSRSATHPKPVVAAVRGRALAGGTGLATACDIVLAHEEARFGFPEVQRRLRPGDGDDDAPPLGRREARLRARRLGTDRHGARGAGARTRESRAPGRELRCDVVEQYITELAVALAATRSGSRSTSSTPSTRAPSMRASPSARRPTSRRAAPPASARASRSSRREGGDA